MRLRESLFGFVIALALALSVVIPALTPAAAGAAPAPFRASSNGRYMIGLKSNTGSPYSLAPGLGRQFGFTPFAIFSRLFDGFAAHLTPTMARALARDPRVSFVEPDFQVQAVSTAIINTGDSRIEAPQNNAWTSDLRVGGPNNSLPGIAILDSGIGPNSDLNVVGGVLCSQTTAVCGAGSYADDLSGEWHGTHVSGIAAGEGNTATPTPVAGVAPGAPLWAVKVLDQKGSGYLSTIIAGLNWVAQNAQADNIAVVNMSFGCNCYSYSLNTATQNAARAGLVLVAAAGNSSQNTSNFYPASSPDVISVSALADWDGLPGGKATTPAICSITGNGWNYPDDTLAGFSNYGADIAAPGVCILSTIPNGASSNSSVPNGLEYLSGTSMASPYVAGAAALYIATYNVGSSSSRWSTVMNGLLNNWSTPENSQCGYSNPYSNEPLLLISPCGVSVPTTGSISGQVTDSVTGNGIPNATVVWNGNSTTTNGNGNYTLSNLAPGTANLVVSATNYTSKTVNSVTVTTGNTTTVNVSLQPKPGTVNVTVTGSSNTPITNATVTLDGASPSSTSSNVYTFNNVTEGSHNLSVSAPGYQTSQQSIDVGPGATVNKTVALSALPGTISGTVTDSSTHAGISGATVAVNGTGLSTTTGAGGTYTISNVPAGNYTVSASASNYQSNSVSGVTVTSGGTTSNVNITLTHVVAPATGTVAGQVMVSFFGRYYAVSGASITVSMGGQNYTGTTDSNGNYSIGNVPAGNGTVSVSDSYGSQSQNVTVSGGQTSTANFYQSFRWGGFY